jgi:hypothetical protein
LFLMLKGGHWAKLPLCFGPWPNFGFRLFGAKRPMDHDFRGQTSMCAFSAPTRSKRFATFAIVQQSRATIWCGGFGTAFDWPGRSKPAQAPLFRSESGGRARAAGRAPCAVAVPSPVNVGLPGARIYWNAAPAPTSWN